jgi:hypothetical protein
MKVRRYRDDYLLPQKKSSSTRGLQRVVEFLRVKSGIFDVISTIVDLYIPDFKRLCDAFSIVATLFVAFV